MCRSEYDTLGTSVKAALVYLGTALIKVRMVDKQNSRAWMHAIKCSFKAL